MTQPVAFISHGSPMLALDQGAWSEALVLWANSLSRPRAILVMSAHWERSGPITVMASSRPATLHDFGGFPEALYQLQYPAPGDPALARHVLELLKAADLEAELDADRPLDHGAWVPLMKAFPAAEYPVIQVSLPRSRTPQLLFNLGRALAPLRKEGVLILASGGVVHNLGRLDWSGHPVPEDWAADFDRWVKERVEERAVTELLETRSRAPHYREAVPTSEHFDPMFFALGAVEDSRPSVLFEGWQHGNLSLRAWVWND